MIFLKFINWSPRPRTLESKFCEVTIMGASLWLVPWTTPESPRKGKSMRKKVDKGCRSHTEGWKKRHRDSLQSRQRQCSTEPLKAVFRINANLQSVGGNMVRRDIWHDCYSRDNIQQPNKSLLCITALSIVSKLLKVPCHLCSRQSATDHGQSNPPDPKLFPHLASEIYPPAWPVTNCDSL